MIDFKNARRKPESNVLIFNFDIFHMFWRTFFMPKSSMYNVPYHNCTYNSLPEDEPSGSKHVEDIKKLKFKILN